MEAWFLVSTSRVLGTADSVFYCRYNGHTLIGIKLSLSTRQWRPHPCSTCEVVGETWVLSFCTFRTCGFPAHLFSLFITHVKGAPRGVCTTALMLWVLCWGSVSWSSFQPPHQPRLMCWRCFHARGPCPAAPRDPPWMQDSRDFKGASWLPHALAITSADLAFWAWLCSRQQVPGSLLHSESTAPFRQSCLSSPHPRPAPYCVLSLFLSRSHPCQFSKRQCKPRRYHVFMEDYAHITLAKWNWMCLPLSSLRVRET